MSTRRPYELWHALEGRSQKVAEYVRLEDALRELRSRISDGDQGAFAIRHPDGRWQHFRRPRRALSVRLRRDFGQTASERPSSSSSERPVSTSGERPLRDPALSAGPGGYHLQPERPRAGGSPDERRTVPPPHQLAAQSGSQKRGPLKSGTLKSGTLKSDSTSTGEPPPVGHTSDFVPRPSESARDSTGAHARVSAGFRAPKKAAHDDEL